MLAGDRFVIETPGGRGSANPHRSSPAQSGTCLDLARHERSWAVTNYWPLIGILLVVIGFALKFNPMLVVTVSAIATGLIAGMDPVEVIGTFGKAFNDNRIIAIVWIVLPVIGLLERFRTAAAGGGGHPQHEERNYGAASDPVPDLPADHRRDRPALDRRPPAWFGQRSRRELAAAEKQHGTLSEAETVKAYSAATDNVGLFFGEDIFFAIGSIVLIQQVLATYGYNLAPLELALWAIPTAIAAFLIHGARLLLLDRKLRSSLPGICRGGGMRAVLDADRTNPLHSVQSPSPR